ncbi:hypothetical protein [Ruminococcus sp.]|uniref:hypothetical protein n=1 Tax=Ruminococcus sp. TaxID=41978 RepID=UPI0025D639BA|nr:hypothetical protein [Ruminococcus sp.]MBQ8965099.1 hypothetical protein [Ruminococcus sp.]
MALELNECPTCGGTITIDREKKTGFCKYCGREFFFDETVNNYNTTNNFYNTNNITADNVTMQNAKTSLQDLIEKEKIYKRLGDVMKLCEVYGDMTDLYPSNYRGWWGNICIATNDFSDVDIDDRSLDNVKKWFSLVEDYAPSGTLHELREDYDNYIEFCMGKRRLEFLTRELQNNEAAYENIKNRTSELKEDYIYRKKAKKRKTRILIIVEIIVYWLVWYISLLITREVIRSPDITVIMVYIETTIVLITFAWLVVLRIRKRKQLSKDDGFTDPFEQRRQELSNLIEAQKNELAELNKKLISLNNVK